MIFKIRKDGGQESTVTGYWLCEFKSLFSIVLLKFEGKSRAAYHEHAFHSVSWLLWGALLENFHRSKETIIHRPSFKPIITKRSTFHKVDSVGTTYVLSFRGPWCKTWKEYLPEEDRERTLTHGRMEVNQ